MKAAPRFLIVAAAAMMLANCQVQQSAAPAPVRQAATAAGAPADSAAQRLGGDRYVVRFAADGAHVALALGADGAILQRDETLAYRPRMQAPDAFLSAPASAAEDFVDAVLRGETGAYRQSGQALVDALNAVQSRMDPARFALAQTHVAEAMAALERNDAPAAALAAMEGYRVLEESTAPATRAHPIEVALLDYSGFKLAALALPGHPNWTEAATAAAFSAQQWDAIRARVSDGAVADMMSELQHALRVAIERRDAAALGAAARVQLAAVDLLERYFDEAYKRGEGALAPMSAN